MNAFALMFLAVFLIAGCSKDPAENRQASQPAVEADNSGRNARDQNEQAKTAQDQSESEADRTISQNIRQAITADDSLSVNGKNVKIITIDGQVTLRGPVASETEKSTIVAKAQQIAGVKNIENQLEVTN